MFLSGTFDFGIHSESLIFSVLSKILLLSSFLRFLCNLSFASEFSESSRNLFLDQEGLYSSVPISNDIGLFSLGSIITDAILSDIQYCKEIYSVHFSIPVASAVNSGRPCVNLFPFVRSKRQVKLEYLVLCTLAANIIPLIITTSLVKEFYTGIKSRTYFISSGTKHNHPNIEVINGIILAAKVHRTKYSNFTCRLLLTNGNKLTQGLPEFTADATGIEKWTEYISLQYCISDNIASVIIDPNENKPMSLLIGTEEYKPSWSKKRLRDDSENSLANERLHKKRKKEDSNSILLKTENIKLSECIPKSKVPDKNICSQNLEDFIKVVSYNGPVNCGAILEIILSQACLNDIINDGKVKEVLGALFATILQLSLKSESTFQVSISEVYQANIILILPNTPLTFQNNKIQSICILVVNPLSAKLTIDLHFEVDDSGMEVHICIPLQSYVTTINRSLTDYVRCLDIDLHNTNTLNNIILLQQSGNRGYLSMCSLNQAIVIPCVSLDTNYFMSTVDFNTDVMVNSANLVALVPQGFEIDLGITVGVKLNTFRYIIPNTTQNMNQEPYMQADALIGKQQVVINAYVRTKEVAYLHIEIIDNINLNSIIQLLGLDEAINQLKVPVVNQLLSNLSPIDIFINIQETVSESTTAIISELGMNFKFERFSQYLQKYLQMLKSMDNIQCRAVVYNPTLDIRSIGLEAVFNFIVPDHINTFSAKFTLKPIYSTPLANPYNIFSLSFTTDTPGGLNIADILVSFGLSNAVNDAKNIPLVNTMISNIKLEDLSFQYNCEQKAIDAFILIGSIVELDLIPGVISVTQFSANLEYYQGSWSADFMAEISLGSENTFIVTLKLSYNESSNIKLSFENNNSEFTIQEFLTIFIIGKVDVPVVNELLKITIDSVELTVNKTETNCTITEGELSLYLESLDIGIKLQQVHFNVVMYRNVENTLNFSFNFVAFISNALYLEVSYNQDTQILSGQVFIASFQQSTLIETITTLLTSSKPLQTNYIFDKISNNPSGIMQVNAKITSNEFSVVTLSVELNKVLTIGSISLENLKFEFENASEMSHRLLATLQISETNQSMVIEFNLNQNTTSTPTISAQIKENSITFGSFLGLFGLKDANTHIPGSPESTNFFDLVVTSGMLEIGLEPFEIIGFQCEVKTINKFTVLENPLISLEQVFLTANYTKGESTPSLDIAVEGLFKLSSVYVKLIGKVSPDGSKEFHTIVTNESAKMQDIINQLTPSSQTPSEIPGQISPDLSVNQLTLSLFFSKDKEYFDFTAVSKVNWCLDLKFEKFYVKDLGGFIHYSILPEKVYQVLLNGKFQFSEKIEMKSSLYFGSHVNTVLDVTVTNLSNVSVPGIADNLLHFNNNDQNTSSITFTSLLPKGMVDISLSSAHINLNITQSVFLFMGNLKALGSGFLIAGQFGENIPGYIFGISLPDGIQWGKIISSLSFIDNILTVTKLNCIVSALDGVKLRDVVTKMETAEQCAIQSATGNKFQFPFSNLKLDDATKDTELTLGVSVYAEFNVNKQVKGSLLLKCSKLSAMPGTETFERFVTVTSKTVFT